MLERTLMIRFLLLALFLPVAVAACGTPGPTATAVSRIAALTPTANPTATTIPTSTITPTFTQAPTATPLPSTPTPAPTSTAKPTLSPATNTPTDTPTATPTAVPPTAVPTAAPPKATARPRPPTPTPTPTDSVQFDITMQRMLQIDENAGRIGNHNIYVHAYDAKGNPLNGVVVCRVYALRLEPPDPHACGITGESGFGQMHFDVYSGDIIYVATHDPAHLPLSPYTRPLEQEPAAMTDLQDLVDGGYCDSIEDCQRRIPINGLVRFHYSYEVHFQRRW